MGDYLKNDLLLFGDLAPDVYKRSSIYDPDSDFILTSDTTFQPGVTYYTREGSGVLVTYHEATVTVGAQIPLNTYYVEGDGPSEQSGKVVPGVNSLVVDDTIGNGVYVLYVVHSVDPDTLKTTLRPIRLVDNDDDAPNRIVGYGNDVYMLYYDVRNIDANTTETLLKLDRKLVFYGKHPSYYQLVRTDTEGNRTVISRVNSGSAQTGSAIPIVSVLAEKFVVTAENKSNIIGKTVQVVTNRVENGEVIAERLEFVADANNISVGDVVYVLPEDTTIRCVLKGDLCFAAPDVSLTDGEVIQLEVFETVTDLSNRDVHNKILSIELIAHKSHVIEDMDISASAIVDFDIDLNNSPFDSDIWVLRKGYLPSTLSITPKLVYADGTTEAVPIDNQCCFVYGLEDIDSTIAGREFRVLFKYFPAKNRNINWTRHSNTSRLGYLYREKTIRIIDQEINSMAKISVIPIWDTTENKYKLVYYPYNIYQARPDGPLTDVRIDQNSFDGTNFSALQAFTIATTVPVDENGNTSIYYQTVAIRLRDRNNVVPFLLANSASNFTAVSGGAYAGRVYGNNAAPYARPIIRYASNTGTYYIDVTTFPTVTAFIENFYRNGEPPAFNSDAEAVTQAPTPSHFILRDIATGNEITTQIAVNSYAEHFVMNTSVNRVGTTVLMEFLNYVDGIYRVIYGVPVEVRS